MARRKRGNTVVQSSGISQSGGEGSYALQAARGQAGKAGNMGEAPINTPFRKKKAVMGAPLNFA